MNYFQFLTYNQKMPGSKSISDTEETPASSDHDEDDRRSYVDEDDDYQNQDSYELTPQAVREMWQKPYSSNENQPERENTNIEPETKEQKLIQQITEKFTHKTEPITNINKLTSFQDTIKNYIVDNITSFTDPEEQQKLNAFIHQTLNNRSWYTKDEWNLIARSKDATNTVAANIEKYAQDNFALKSTSPKSTAQATHQETVEEQPKYTVEDFADADREEARLTEENRNKKAADAKKAREKRDALEAFNNERYAHKAAEEEKILQEKNQQSFLETQDNTTVSRTVKNIKQNPEQQKIIEEAWLNEDKTSARLLERFLKIRKISQLARKLAASTGLQDYSKDFTELREITNQNLTFDKAEQLAKEPLPTDRDFIRNVMDKPYLDALHIIINKMPKDVQFQDLPLHEQIIMVKNIMNKIGKAWRPKN